MKTDSTNPVEFRSGTTSRARVLALGALAVVAVAAAHAAQLPTTTFWDNIRPVSTVPATVDVNKNSTVQRSAQLRSKSRGFPGIPNVQVEWLIVPVGSGGQGRVADRRTTDQSGTASFSVSYEGLNRKFDNYLVFRGNSRYGQTRKYIGRVTVVSK